MIIVYLLFGSIFLIGPTDSLVGYDCGHRALNITSFSLLSTKPCSIKDHEIKTSSKRIQLAQLAKNRMLHVYQCRVKVRRTITRCSWLNDAQVVKNGMGEYIREITPRECLMIHETRMYKFSQDIIFDALEANSSSIRMGTLAGSVDSSGKCSGSSYADTWGSWDSVIVQAQIDISVRDLEVPVDLSSEMIVLPSGFRCPYPQTTCRDSEYGMTVWEKIRPSQCAHEDYDVLFEGESTYIPPTINDDGTANPAVYHVEEGETTFALTGTRKTRRCYQEVVETEHPRLFIIEGTSSGFSKSLSPLSVHNTDLFSYVNSKFVYLEKHLRRQLTSMYSDLIFQKCKIEQEVLQQRLTMASISLQEFSFLQGNGPGYTALLGGEVVYLIKCNPVPVSIRESSRCFQEIPIMVNNKSRFLSPKTHIIQDHGHEITCSSILPSLYLLDDRWYSISPFVQPSEAPQSLSPKEERTWAYIKTGDLATSGIYSTSALSKLTDHIMYPIETPAISNTIVRSISHSNADTQGLQFQNLFDEDTIAKVATTTWNKMWGFFGILGNVVSGLIGFYISARVIKFMLDTVINCLMIKETLGLGWKISWGFWDSATSYLVNKKHLKTPPPHHSMTPTNIVIEEKDEPESPEEKRDQHLYPILHPYLHSNPTSVSNTL